MAIKTFKPYTPARRNMTVSAFEGVDKKARPERSLTETLKKHAGRNSYGRITVRHHGGGNRVKYRGGNSFSHRNGRVRPRPGRRYCRGRIDAYRRRPRYREIHFAHASFRAFGAKPQSVIRFRGRKLFAGENALRKTGAEFR